MGQCTVCCLTSWSCCRNTWAFVEVAAGNHILAVRMSARRQCVISITEEFDKRNLKLMLLMINLIRLKTFTFPKSVLSYMCPICIICIKYAISSCILSPLSRHTKHMHVSFKTNAFTTVIKHSEKTTVGLSWHARDLDNVLNVHSCFPALPSSQELKRWGTWDMGTIPAEKPGLGERWHCWRRRVLRSFSTCCVGHV